MLRQEDLLKLSSFLADVRQIVRHIRLQDYLEAKLEYQAVLSSWKEMILLLRQEIPWQELSIMLESISKVDEAICQQDMVLLADYMQGLVAEDIIKVIEKFLPAFQEKLDKRQKDKPDSAYWLEYTSSGCLTVRTNTGGSDYYFHSNIDPAEEACIAVEKVYRPEAERWIVWGCGLGYHIKELYRQTHGSAELFVYEPDLEMLNLCRQEGVVQDIPEDVLHMTYDPHAEFFIREELISEPGIFMHFPSVRNVKDPEAAIMLSRYHTHYNGIIFHGEQLIVNFRCNRKNCTAMVSSLRPLFESREVILLGGGPSLDHKLAWLKEHRAGKTVLAVGTVWAKLLREGIAPDCVVVLDPLDRTFRQFPDEPGEDIPLILASSAQWRLGKYYKGPKYLALQRDFDRAVKLAEELGEELFDADAGTVTSFGLDIAIRLGAVRVWLLGLDFAYPEGRTHAEGTPDADRISTDALDRVKSVTGGMVATDGLFNMYREAVEAQIRKASHVRIINISDCGAYVEGAETPADGSGNE